MGNHGKATYIYIYIYLFICQQIFNHMSRPRHFFSPLKAHSPRRADAPGVLPVPLVGHHCLGPSAQESWWWGSCHPSPHGAWQLKLRWLGDLGWRSLARKAMGKSPNFGSGVASLSHGHVVKCSNSSYSPHQNIIVIVGPRESRLSTCFLYPTEPPLIPTIGSSHHIPWTNHHEIPSTWPWETARPPPASSRSRAGGGRRAPSARPHPANQPWGAWSAAGPMRGLELPGPWRFGHGKLLVSGSFWLFFWWFYTRKIEVGKNVMIKREVEDGSEVSL